MDDDKLWKETAQWLVNMGALPSDHKVVWDDARVDILANTLRDGVVLCNLALKLVPGCIDGKDMSLRPQMSQFLCTKNIRAFLQALQNCFDITSPNDLFEPEMLFDYSDFKRVLHTLSILSNTPQALDTGVAGFTVPKLTVSSDYYNQSVFLNHSTDTQGSALDGTSSHYGISGSVNNARAIEEEEEIYHKICVAPNRAPKPKSVPLEKRDFCIQELLETEKNYIQALHMIKKKFETPLEQVLSRDDADIIFKHIRALSEIHTGLLSDLHVANQVPNGRISDCFLRWKDRLTLYGDYCSNFPRAQQLLNELCHKNEAIAAAVEKCQRETNEGRYTLNTLLCLPIQRVLKYHLLLKELVKNTLHEHDDFLGLNKALDAMLDLSAYINEVKRDSEMLTIIADIQNSITDYNLPKNKQLKDYGRLHKDGEVKVKSHKDQGVKNRYVFVFDKMLLLCKATKGDQYVYKEEISLASYRIEDIPVCGSGGGIQSNSALLNAKSWQHQFLLVHCDQKTAYTIATKTPDDKQKWIEALQTALDNIEPAAVRQTDHESLQMATFQSPTYCDQCQKLLRGIFYQGYKCSRCQKCLHRDCIAQCKSCHALSPRVPSPLGVSRSTPVLTTVRAKNSYSGGSRDNHLSFEIGDVILVTRKHSAVLWEGRIGNRAGFFPAVHVEELASTNLDDYPWFAGPMCRERAETILETCPQGTYLVRISNKQLSGTCGQPAFAISLKVGDAVKHMRVCSWIGEASGFPGSGPDLLYLCKKKLFRNILELITWYQEHSLAESFVGLNETLRTPFKSVTNGSSGVGPSVLSWAIAVHDFEPSNSSTMDQAGKAQFLPLVKGERVAILSKEGDERGWWKGQINNNYGFFPKTYVQEINDH